MTKPYTLEEVRALHPHRWEGHSTGQTMVDTDRLIASLEALEQWTGPTCPNDECPDYDGAHPYHFNAVEKFWTERQKHVVVEEVVSSLKAQNDRLRTRIVELEASLARFASGGLTLNDIYDAAMWRLVEERDEAVRMALLFAKGFEDTVLSPEQREWAEKAVRAHNGESDE